VIESYAMVLYPGIIVSDTSEEKVSNRDPKQFKLPKHAFGFRFFDKEVIEGKTGNLYGPAHNFSPWYYKGKVRTLEEVKAQEPSSVLCRNMENNDYERIVDTEFGQSIPMNPEDIVIHLLGKKEAKQ